MIETTIENCTLTMNDRINAVILASRFRAKHGYWMAMYHCMTLVIHCRLVKNQRLMNQSDIEFWWEVRNVVYKSR